MAGIVSGSRTDVSRLAHTARTDEVGGMLPIDSTSATSTSMGGNPLWAGAPWLVTIIFAAIGTLHLVRPQFFEQIMPAWVPADGPLGRRALVVASGAAEILGAVGVIFGPTRVVAGWGLILLLVAVFPANVDMLTTARRRHAAGWWQALLAARLPMQFVLMWWVWMAAVRTSGAVG